MKNSSLLLLFVGIVFGGVAVHAAPQLAIPADQAAQVEARLQAKHSAFVAFSRGDDTAALAQLALTIVKGPTDRSADEQLVAALAEMAYWLSNRSESARAADVARLAISRGESAVDRLSVSDQARVYTSIGELEERLIGNTDKAAAAYEKALAADPGSAAARRHLTIIRAKAAEAQSKARENDRMRQQASTTHHG